MNNIKYSVQLFEPYSAHGYGNRPSPEYEYYITSKLANKLAVFAAEKTLDLSINKREDGYMYTLTTYILTEKDMEELIREITNKVINKLPIIL
jgi:hypothetical protein